MRVSKMGYAQRVTKRDKKGRVTSSFERVRIVVPDGLPPSLPPPYTGHKNLTKRVYSDREHAEWTARFLAMIDEAPGWTTIHRELTELNGLSLDELIERGAVPHRVFATLDRKCGEIFGEPASKKVTAEPVIFETIIGKWMEKTKNGKKKGPKAREDMERAVKRFTSWLKHDDMARVTFENCRDYRDHLYQRDPDSRPLQDALESTENVARAVLSCRRKPVPSGQSVRRSQMGSRRRK
jgi:hypothetical protein